MKEDHETKTIMKEARRFRKKKKYEQAIEECRRIIDENPTLVEAYVDMIVSFCEQGKLDQANDVLQQAFARNLSSSALYADQGYLLAENGELDKSVQADQKAIGLDKANWVAYRNMGFIYAQRGDHKNALNSYWQGFIHHISLMDLTLVLFEALRPRESIFLFGLTTIILPLIIRNPLGLIFTIPLAFILLASLYFNIKRKDIKKSILFGVFAVFALYWQIATMFHLKIIVANKSIYEFPATVPISTTIKIFITFILPCAVMIGLGIIVEKITTRYGLARKKQALLITSIIIALWIIYNVFINFSWRIFGIFLLFGILVVTFGINIPDLLRTMIKGRWWWIKNQQGEGPKEVK